MKKLIIIYFLALLNLNYGQCRVNFVNIGGDYILEIVESGEDFEVISHNGIGADFTARIATGALQKADFQVKIVNYSSINSKCGFNLKNGRNSGSYANPGRGLVELNEKLTNEQIDGMRKLSEKMDRNVEQIKQNLNSNNTYNSSSNSNINYSKPNREYSKNLRNSGIEKFNREDYYGAVEDYDRALRFTDDRRQLSLLHSLIGRAKADLKNDYYGAIKEYNIAIELSPDWPGPWENRAYSKWKLGLDCCSDYKRACQEGACENYYKMYK